MCDVLVLSAMNKSSVLVSVNLRLLVRQCCVRSVVPCAKPFASPIGSCSCFLVIDIHGVLDVLVGCWACLFSSLLSFSVLLGRTKYSQAISRAMPHSCRKFLVSWFLSCLGPMSSLPSPPRPLHPSQERLCKTECVCEIKQVWSRALAPSAILSCLIWASRFFHIRQLG